MISVSEIAHMNLAEKAKLFGTWEAHCREQAGSSKNCASEPQLQLFTYAYVCVVG